MEIENLCDFYASKYHLSVILLEYLKNKNTKKTRVVTFLEDEIEDEIKALVGRYKYDRNIIKEVDFNRTEKIIEKEIPNTKDIIFIIEGSMGYIREVREYISKTINEKSSVKIITCYNFETQRNFMSEELKRNDKILFTTGEKIID